MKTITIKSPKVNGKLYVDAYGSRNNRLRFFTDPTQPIKSININGHDFDVRISIELEYPSRVYSESSGEYVEIPAAKRQPKFSIERYTIGRSATGAVAGNYKHPELIFHAIKPLLPELFANKSIFSAYAEKELRKKISSAQKRLKEYSDKANATRKFVAEARKAVTSKQPQQILKLNEKNYYF